MHQNEKFLTCRVQKIVTVFLKVFIRNNLTYPSNRYPVITLYFHNESSKGGEMCLNLKGRKKEGKKRNKKERKVKKIKAKKRDREQ